MSDVRFLVKRYLDEGFGRPHPMPKGQKGPRIKGWQNPEKIFALEDFGPEDNVGTALTNDLVDIDLDCAEAVQVAPTFLPPTGRVFGRGGKRKSHYLYKAHGVDSYKFLDISEKDPETGRMVASTILEIRAGSKHQTMLPPSVHPSGEPVEWEEPLGDWTEWEKDACWLTARNLAATVIVGRHWCRGSRHDAALAFGGFLASRDVPIDVAEQMMVYVVSISGDEEVEDRMRAVKESYHSFKANHKTTGLPKLKELLGADVTARLGDWYKSSDQADTGHFRLTESGDADAFAAFGRDIIRFDFRRGSWLRIEKETGIWIPDDTAFLTEYMKAFMRFQQKECNDPKYDLKDRKVVFKWYIQGESRSRITNALHLARSVPPIANSGEDWDLDPFLLGCPNGVVDLRTGLLRRALPEEHISKRVRVPFNPDADCPLWEATLRGIFAPGPEFDQAESDALIMFMQEAIGYSITGDCREECCFITWGEGGNGKGTIINTMGWILGDYRDDMPFSTIEKAQHGSGIPNDVAKLFQKRFITCAEANEFRLNESRLKALTGRDPMTARFLNKEFFTFIPVGKIWMATNNRPKIVGTDEGIWRRIHLIPFIRTFVGHANLQLKDQLLKEGSGILNWSVEGARRWLERGKLEPPKTVLAATEEYRHESNPVSPFVDSCCVTGSEYKVAARQAWIAYSRWCNDCAVDQNFRLSEKGFHQHMKMRFQSKQGAVDRKHQAVFYFGVGLRENRQTPAADPEGGAPAGMPF